MRAMQDARSEAGCERNMVTIASSSRAALRGGAPPCGCRVERPRTGVGIDVVFMLCIRSRDALLKRGSERPGQAGEQGPKVTFVSREVIYARLQLV